MSSNVEKDVLIESKLTDPIKEFEPVTVKAGFWIFFSILILGSFFISLATAVFTARLKAESELIFISLLLFLSLSLILFCYLKLVRAWAKRERLYYYSYFASRAFVTAYDTEQRLQRESVQVKNTIKALSDAKEEFIKGLEEKIGELNEEKNKQLANIIAEQLKTLLPVYLTTSQSDSKNDPAPEKKRDTEIDISNSGAIFARQDEKEEKEEKKEVPIIEQEAEMSPVVDEDEFNESELNTDPDEPLWEDEEEDGGLF